MAENLPALGFCPTCNEEMITQNGVPKCFVCTPSPRPSHLKKPPPVAAHIDEADFTKVMGKDGKGSVPKSAPVSKGTTAKDALDIMRHLPIPETEQQFKQIKKIIKQLEKLVGEDNGD